MSKKTEPKARYKVLIGMNSHGKRYEPGDTITFDSGYDCKWLCKMKAIEPVGDKS